MLDTSLDELLFVNFGFGSILGAVPRQAPGGEKVRQLMAKLRIPLLPADERFVIRVRLFEHQLVQDIFERDFFRHLFSPTASRMNCKPFSIMYFAWRRVAPR